MGTDRQNFAGEKPVRKGEVHGVEIIGTGSQGDGVAKIKGLVIFVPGAPVGANVSVRIVDVFRNSALGEVVTP